MFYFAYGSNINRSQMNRRCSNQNPKFVTKGYLDGYKLVFDGYSSSRNGLVADIRKADGFKLPFVIWEISNQDDINSLDRSEGFQIARSPEDNSYNKILIDVPGYNDVYVYIMTRRFIKGRGKYHTIPSDYIETIRNGYKEFGLDESILDYAINEAKNQSATHID